jgi:hypothetical protein
VQVQLAVNFARNNGVRFVIKNTSHDFLGKYLGAGCTECKTWNTWNTSPHERLNLVWCRDQSWR